MDTPLVVDVIRRLSLLNEAARALTSELDHDALLDRILDLTREVFGFDACAILLEDQGELIIRRARGYDEAVVASFRGHPGEGVTGRALSRNEAVVESDLSRAEGYVAGVRGAVAEVAIPLRLNHTVLGVLDAESREPLALSSDDIQLLQAFASHAAVALHNAAQHERLERHRAALERRLEIQRILARASEVMLSSMSCDEVLDEILALAKEALRFETCAVLLLEPDREHLVLRAAHGYRDDWRELRIPVGRGITGEAVKTGAPVVVQDVRADPRYIEGVSGGRSELAVPLRVRDQIIGVFDVEALVVGAFDEEATEMVVFFARYAAVSLRNAAQLEGL
ncbi:MAG: GAF domain-containing protein, partial [Polyangia bacterium]|nr:GAF domain-containing protein [Polyangia bacterium]